MELDIIYEDKHVLCLIKPPGIPSQSDKTEDDDLMSAGINYLKNKGDNPYLGLIQRLDRPVGGVIVFAKNDFANKELSRQVQERHTKKEYFAVVCGKMTDEKGTLEDYIKKLKTINMSKITTADDKQGKLAQLEYEVLETAETEEYGTLCLVRINLLTGRHHQIRLQFSNLGTPIWGDNKYNKVFMKKKDFTQPALWSHKFGFRHPKTKKYTEFTSFPNSYPFTVFDFIKSVNQQEKTNNDKV